MRSISIPVILLSLVLCQADAGQGKGKGKGHQQNGNAVQPQSGTRVFLPVERQAILDYYSPGTGNLPPGLAKRGSNLPPGLQKQLQRNGQLPPGLQKRLTPFPAALEQRLSPLPAGCRRTFVGGWALLINDSTNVILDVLDLTHRR